MPFSCLHAMLQLLTGALGSPMPLAAAPSGSACIDATPSEVVEIAAMLSQDSGDQWRMVARSCEEVCMRARPVEDCRLVPPPRPTDPALRVALSDPTSRRRKRSKGGERGSMPPPFRGEPPPAPVPERSTLITTSF